MTDIPQTVWRPTNGNGEVVTATICNVIDTAGVFLVDTAGLLVVDTGTDFQTTPQTIWVQSDGS